MDTNKKINGYEIREMIRTQELRRDVLQREFENSLKAFPGEQKRDPRTVAQELRASEEDVAYAQTLQSKYNLTVQVDVQGQQVPLTFVVKSIGSAGRLASLWRNVVGGKKDRYYDRDDVRQAGETRAEATISTAQAAEMADEYAKRAGALRAALATGNATYVHVRKDGSLTI